MCGSAANQVWFVDYMAPNGITSSIQVVRFTRTTVLFLYTVRSFGVAVRGSKVILREFLSVLRFPQSVQSTEFGKEYVTIAYVYVPI